MPAPRIQTGGGPDTPRLRPGASPVDTFRQTQEGYKLAQVGQALAGLQPSLARFGAAVEARQNEADRQKGEAEANRLSHEVKSYKEAIDSGLIQPHQSPIFRLAAQESFGRIAANKYGAQLQLAFAQSDVADSDKPEDFDKFEAQFRETYIKDSFKGDEDPYLVNAFNSGAEAQAQGLRSQFAQAAAKRVETNSYEGLSQEVMQTVLNQGADAGAAISHLMDISIAGGANKRRVNFAVAQAVIDASRRLGSDPLMAQGLLDSLKAGTGKLSTLPEVAKALTEARLQIAQDRYAEDERQHATESRERQDRIRDVLGEFTTALDSSPDVAKMDVRDFAKRINEILPGQGDTVFQLHDAYVRRELDDDPSAKSSAFLAVHGMDPARPGRFLGIQGAANLLASRQITVETFNQLVSAIGQRDTGGSRNSFTKDPTLNDARGEIYSLFVSQFGFEAPETRRKADQARDELTLRYINAVSAKPDMTDAERWELAFKLKDEIYLARIGVKAAAFSLTSPKVSPQKVDWSSGVVADASQIRALRNEWESIKAKTRVKFSPATGNLLAGYGITLHEDVEAFLKQQEEFINR